MHIIPLSAGDKAGRDPGFADEGCSLVAVYTNMRSLKAEAPLEDLGTYSRKIKKK